MTLLQVFGQKILDAVFPKRCLGCGTFDTWLCDACHTSLPLLPEQHCPLCKKMITPHGRVCPACSDKTALDGVFVASTFDHELLRTIIHYFKYKFIEELSEPLGLLLAQAINNAHLPSPDIMMPVPLHRRRLRWRGFNQAQRLAQALDLTIPLETRALVRTRYTTAQVKMHSRKRRMENLSGAFALRNPHIVKNRHVLLIDDVITTGTTLEQCARILKASGAITVSGLVIVRE